MSTPIAKPWLVFRIHLTRNEKFPYKVVGVNLNHAPGSPGFIFAWHVPNLDSEQYDLSHVP